MSSRSTWSDFSAIKRRAFSRKRHDKPPGMRNASERKQIPRPTTTPEVARRHVAPWDPDDREFCFLSPARLQKRQIFYHLFGNYRNENRIVWRNYESTGCCFSVEPAIFDHFKQDAGRTRCRSPWRIQTVCQIGFVFCEFSFHFQSLLVEMWKMVHFLPSVRWRPCLHEGESRSGIFRPRQSDWLAHSRREAFRLRRIRNPGGCPERGRCPELHVSTFIHWPYLFRSCSLVIFRLY